MGILFFLSASILHGVTVTYNNLGTFTASSYTDSGVEVIGSDQLNFLNFNGLGVVGGIDSLRVDPTTGSSNESLDFFATGSDSFASFIPDFGGSSNYDSGGFDSYTVEAFGAFENFLGSFNYSGTGISLSGDDVISRLGLTSATQIKLIASGDGFILGSIEFTPTSAIPEPETYGVLLGALALVGVVFRRRRKKFIGPGCR